MPGIVTSTMSLFISSMPDSHIIINSGSVAFSSKVSYSFVRRETSKVPPPLS
jgi:hypothetical protein